MGKMMTAHESPTLTFAALDAKIDATPQHPAVSAAMSKTARWAWVVGIIATALGLLLAKLLPSDDTSTVMIVATFLVIELVALGVAVASQLPRAWPTFTSERWEAADELDFSLSHHQKLIQWLQGHPRGQLETLSNYAGYRHERMRERLPLLTGGIEKLGALPIFIALYIQFKDAHWPPHPSWLEIALILGLIFGYWASLLQINVRFRLQMYDVLLKKALSETRAVPDRDSDESTH